MILVLLEFINRFLWLIIMHGCFRNTHFCCLHSPQTNENDMLYLSNRKSKLQTNKDNKYAGAGHESIAMFSFRGLVLQEHDKPKVGRVLKVVSTCC